MTNECAPTEYMRSTADGSGTDTYSYDYDKIGNIKTVHQSGGDITYTYDAIGNPLQYRSGMNMTWQNGRQLASISQSGQTVSYAYNGDGVRTGKTVNGVTTNYIVDGSTILSQTGTAGASPYVIDYLYDENGNPYGLEYNGSVYYYEYDGQGNVVALIDHHAAVVVRYTYDAFGKPIAVTDGSGSAITDPSNIANLNSFRYRGYCYDTETGLYYLQSRYYDPITGRFVNADGTINANSDLKSASLFVYCGNNPVGNSDPGGKEYYDEHGIRYPDEMSCKAPGVIERFMECGRHLKPRRAPTEEQRMFAAIVYSEAANQNTYTKNAIAHAIKNRLGKSALWSDGDYESITQIITEPYPYSGCEGD